MDFSDLFIGGLSGGLLVFVSWRLSNRMLDSAPKPTEDATPRWFELAATILKAFDGLTVAISDLNKEVKADAHDENAARIGSTALLESLTQAIQKATAALEDVVRDTKDIKKMTDETKTRIALDNEAALVRYEVATGTLADHTKRLTEIEAVVGDIKTTLDAAPLVKPDALTTLSTSIADAINAALDVRLPAARADPLPEKDTPVQNLAAVTVVVTSPDKPITEPEDKADVQP